MTASDRDDAAADGHGCEPAEALARLIGAAG